MTSHKTTETRNVEKQSSSRFIEQGLEEAVSFRIVLGKGSAEKIEYKPVFLLRKLHLGSIVRKIVHLHEGSENLDLVSLKTYIDQPK